MDALITAWRLVTAGGGLAFDRLRPSGVDSVPFVLSELTPGWLTHALAPIAPGVRVRSFEPLHEHSGTTTRARIRLTYDDRGGAQLPETMFVKIAPRALVQRLFVTIIGLGHNEVGFYRSVRPGLPVRAPEVYAAACSGGGRRFVLLLEDLAAAGARFAVVGYKAGLDEARAVMVELAHLHAAFWETPRFTRDLAWVPSFESRQKDMPWERFLTGQMVRRAVRMFAADSSLDLQGVAEICVARRDGLEALWLRGPRTLVHGDCHIGNLFFEEGRVGFLDWQVTSRAPGMRDVSYFLCHSLPGDLRTEHELDLIGLYLETLASHGVAAPDPESTWRQHQLFALYAWIAAAFTAAAGEGLQAREIAVAGLRRATRAVTELRSVDLARRELG